MKYLIIILSAAMMNVIALASSYAAERKLDFDTYGVAYLIEDKRVEELFYVTLEAFSYLNEVELRYKGHAKRGILAISMEGIFEDGKYSEEKLSKFSEEIRSILELFEVGEEQCLVSGFKTRERALDGNLTEDLTTVAVFNNKNNTTDEQIKCLYIGVLASFGLDPKNIDDLSKMNSRQLAKKIIELDF